MARQTSPEEIYDFFLKPPFTNKYKTEWKQPDKEKIIKFMVDEHDFSQERVEKVIERLNTGREASTQSSLAGFIKK